MSYRHNVHEFRSNPPGKKSGRGGDSEFEPPELMRYRMCEKCKGRSAGKEDNIDSELAEKILMKIDKRKIVYDEEEIDYINDNQSKIYISSVDVNPYLRFGIRTHYERLTAAMCLHSMFNIFHRDFILIWLHLFPALYMLWQLIELQMGISHVYKFPERLDANFVMTSIALGLMVAWFFIKTGYYMFYSISYKVEYEFNKWIKIANMAVIFMYSIFFAYSLFNHTDPKQYELGYLTIFIISTLLVLNVILTLNPIYREEGVDSYSRSCCAS